VQKRHVLICEDSLCPKKLPDVSGHGLGEGGRYNGPPVCERKREERVKRRSGYWRHVDR